MVVVRRKGKVAIGGVKEGGGEGARKGAVEGEIVLAVLVQ